MKQMETMWHLLLRILIFQKLGKSGFCTRHLQESIAHAVTHARGEANKVSIER